MIDRGRVHALIGENGAGKSTLVNILGGVEQPSAGSLSVDGQLVRFTSVRDAAARGIGIIHQELQLFPNLSCTDNLFVARELLTRGGFIDHERQHSIAAATLKRLGQSFDPATRVGALPLGIQQLVEIARALVQDVRILMMDEPTSALTAVEAHTLFNVIQELASHGVGIVYISHRLEELLDIADEVTVLRDGLVVGHAPTDQIDVPWIVTRMTGREKPSAPRLPSAENQAEYILTIEDFSLPARAGRAPLHHINLSARRGEIVGVYGLMGSGRTELFESILGVHRDGRGRIALGDRDLADLDVHARVESGVFLAPEDRQASGLVPTMTVTENITLSSVDALTRYGYLSPGRESEAAAKLRDRLRIKCATLSSAITSLSGGNQQKAVLARGLMKRPTVMLLDEPTRGVDVGARAEIITAMRQIAADGTAVMFSSSDLGEVFEAADRIVVIANGRIAAEFQQGQATEAQVASAASSSLDSRTGAVRE